MSERIVLDPSEVADTRTELDITPWLKQEGLDWGNAEIAAYMAEQAIGQAPVDFRVPNRQITGSFQFTGTVGGTTTVQARSAIQAKLATIQREGGWLKRITNSGGTVYADLVNASAQLTSITGWESARGQEMDAPFTLEAIPDFYGDETTFSSHPETTLPEVIFTQTGIHGDVPGRTRIVVTEADGDDQLGLMWGIRSRHYDAASTARLAYEAEALGPLDTAVAAAQTGASGGTVVQHTSLATTWTPVLSTHIGGTQALTHVGSYNVWARLRSPDGAAVQARLVSDVGDLTRPSENDAWTFPGASNFYMALLGQVRIDKPPAGTHRWQGIIQGKGTVGGEDLQVDRIWFQPVDEFAGCAIAPFTSEIGATTFSARDEFNQTAGTLTGKTLPVGGTWAFAGDVDDYSLNTTGHYVSRAPAGVDTAPHLALAGTATPGAIVVQADFYTNGDADCQQGVFARYSGGTVGLHVALASNGPPGLYSAGALLAQLGSAFVDIDRWYTVRLLVAASGLYAAWYFPQGATPGAPDVVGLNSQFATGGALATGRFGIYNNMSDTGAQASIVDNFAAWAPTVDAAVFANRVAQLRTDGAYRQDSGGIAYGPVTRPLGDEPRFPQAGLENRTVEVLVKNTRGDFDQVPDSGIDDLTVQVAYRPSWLFVPDS